jgi:alanine dehydrogenase
LLRSLVIRADFCDSTDPRITADTGLEGKNMIVLTAEETRRALPMVETIEAMKKAYAALSDGRAEVPLRTQLPIPPHQAVSLFMPAFIQDTENSSLAVKVVSVYPENPARGLPLIHAIVILLEVETGRPLALVEGGVLTAIRTGAASGAATDTLARQDSQVAAIFGAGVQGRTQLEAVCTVREIHTAWIFDPNPELARRFVSEMAGYGPIPGDLRVASAPAEALADADVVCTATTSQTPVFSDKDLKPGVHINGVGSYTPEMQEVPPETVLRARVIVDARSASLVEAGDLVQPIRQGRLAESDIHAELGEILLGRKPGRSDPHQVTFFKSVGVAVQDAAAAALALKNAKAMGLGKDVNL